MWKRLALLLTVICSVLAVSTVVTTGTADATVVSQNFGTSSMTVFAGSQVTLHWGSFTNQLFLLTSPSPSLPNFGSSSEVIWPQGSNASYNSTWGWWATTNSNTVSIAIPSSAAGGTQYKLNLDTCDTSWNCNNSSSSNLVLTVAGSNWSQTPYTSAFSHVVTMAQTGGGPTAVTFSPGDTLWSTSEFGARLNGNGPYSVAYNAYSPPSQPLSTSTLTGVSNDIDLYFSPFAQCFSSPCAQANYSELSEAMTYANGRVWSTEGGWEDYTGTVNNYSEIVSVDPNNPSSLCGYVVPGSKATDDAEVIGVTATGTGSATRIWYVAQDPIGGHPYIGSFQPSQVGAACPNVYTLTPGSTPSFTEVPVPGNPWPNQIGADPDGSVWVTATLPNTVNSVPNVYVYHANTTSMLGYSSYASTNTYAGLGAAFPWDVVADANYVYATNFGDGNLIQIEKNGPDPGQVNVVPIPFFSDQARGFGLALQGNSLYLTAGANFGVVNVGTWERASQACSPHVNCAPGPTSATEYTGLMPVVDPSTGTNFNAVAVSSDGQVALSNYDKEVIRLIP